MNEDKFMSIYVQLKENSIGSEKKCKYNKKTVVTILKSSVLSFTALLCCSGIVGCKKFDKTFQSEQSNVVETDTSSNISIDWHNYGLHDIVAFSKLRVKDLLDSYNLDNYSFDTSTVKSSYNYTEDDYRKISELDETYLYGFYNMTDVKTINEVCKALGYTDMDDYLIKKEYVDTKGLPDYTRWSIEAASVTSDIMYEQNYGEKWVK